jgi:hypothetical protein
VSSRRRSRRAARLTRGRSRPQAARYSLSEWWADRRGTWPIATINSIPPPARSGMCGDLWACWGRDPRSRTVPCNPYVHIWPRADPACGARGHDTAKVAWTENFGQLPAYGDRMAPQSIPPRVHPGMKSTYRGMPTRRFAPTTRLNSPRAQVWPRLSERATPPGGRYRRRHAAGPRRRPRRAPHRAPPDRRRAASPASRP